MIEIFISLILISAICVILSKNIIQSVLYLILVFLLSSILFIYLGADFIGLIILIVYIGAIAVLFLFVVMMLNIRLLEVYSTFYIYLPLAFFLCLILFIEVIYLFFKNFNIIYTDNLIIYYDWTSYNNIKIKAIGQLLFNDIYIYFIGATLLLFVAMVGAILLTLDKTSIKSSNNTNYRIHSKNINWKYIK